MLNVNAGQPVNNDLHWRDSEAGAAMHVVMLSDVETQGGAAIAASRLAQALTESGHRVTRLVAAPDEEAHEWATYDLSVKYPLPWFSRLRWHLHRAEGRERFGNQLVQRQLQRLLAELRPDVINVHGLHFTFHPRWTPVLLRVCIAHAPTVWTLHDMWSFTGRCVYNYGCENFVTGCDAACPTALQYPVVPPNTIAPAWKERQRLLSDCPQLAAVTPSHWLAREAQRGLWAKHRVEVIQNGLPLTLYRPVKRAEARRTLGIATQGWTLLFAAQNLADPRKGWPLLKAALTYVRQRPITLLTLGNDDLRASLSEVAGLSIHPFQHITDERLKALIYSAADLLIHPAPLDNAPLVVGEALACGTPVAGFAVGGVPEMVIEGQTGWLATEVSALALAQTIDQALDDLNEGRELRSTCRKIAERQFDDTTQAQRYQTLFRTLQTPAQNEEAEWSTRPVSASL